MRKQIVKVNILFEVIAPAVWDDSLVNNVDLSDNPTVETRLRKKFFHQAIIADLHISNTHSQTLHLGMRGQGTCIAVVKDPTGRDRVSVDPWNCEKLRILEFVAVRRS